MNEKMDTKKFAVSLRSIILVVVLIILFAFSYVFFGIFVIQPMGAIPDGVTIIYKRFGTNLDFIESPDGLSVKAIGGVSIIGRLGGMAVIGKLKDDIYLRIPYFKFLYLISTNWKEYER